MILLRLTQKVPLQLSLIVIYMLNPIYDLSSILGISYPGPYSTFYFILITDV